MDLPQTHTFNQQQAGGGQIMFGPSDGYLYLVTGHGGEQANRESSNDTSSLLGNIIRFNVDKGVTGKRLNSKIDTYICNWPANCYS